MTHGFIYKVVFTDDDGEHVTDSLEVEIESDCEDSEDLEPEAYSIADSQANKICDENGYYDYYVNLEDTY